jgi:hypothetical protein
MENQQLPYQGPSAGMVLFVVFLVLKLTGKIGWSWWWVTAPLWGGFAVILAILAVFGLVLGVWWLIAR